MKKGLGLATSTSRQTTRELSQGDFHVISWLDPLCGSRFQGSLIVIIIIITTPTTTAAATTTTAAAATIIIIITIAITYCLTTYHYLGSRQAVFRWPRCFFLSVISTSTNIFNNGLVMII